MTQKNRINRYYLEYNESNSHWKNANKSRHYFGCGVGGSSISFPPLPFVGERIVKHMFHESSQLFENIFSVVSSYEISCTCDKTRWMEKILYIKYPCKPGVSELPMYQRKECWFFFFLFSGERNCRSNIKTTWMTGEKIYWLVDEDEYLIAIKKQIPLTLLCHH